MSRITSNSEKIHTLSSNLEKNKNNLSNQIFFLVQILGELIVFVLKGVGTILEATYKLFIATEKSVKGEIVLITGTGHGIGKELALKYASQGATVVCWDIDKKNNDETVKEIFKNGYPLAHSYTCDVTNSGQVKELSQKVLKEVGDVTILINNAGILYSRPFLSHTDEEIKKMVNINVMAHFWILQSFLPTMIENNRGHIVALSSMAGLRGIKNAVPYCTTKYAVRGMMDAMYAELQKDPNCKIQLTTIFPYLVDTGLCKKPVIRFPKLFPIVHPKDAAAHIMSAQRRGISQTTIPTSLVYLNVIMEALPAALVKLIFDFAGTSLESDI